MDGWMDGWNKRGVFRFASIRESCMSMFFFEKKQKTKGALNPLPFWIDWEMRVRKVVRERERERERESGELKEVA